VKNPHISETGHPTDKIFCASSTTSAASLVI